MSKDSKPEFWRSLAELNQDPSFQEKQAQEFDAPMDESAAASPGRRNFLQAMGATLALSAATAGCRWEKDEILPLARRPEGVIPGEPRSFATTMELDGVGTGLLVTSVDGRPIKIEGNPKHPDSLGATGIYHQSSILDLYDPDRSRMPALRGRGRRSASVEDFQAWARGELERLRAARGQGLAVLVESTSSPTVQRLKQELLATMPLLRWAEWCVNNRDEAIAGSRLAFGGALRPIAALDKAAVVVLLDADPIAPTVPAGVAAGRNLMRAREPDDQFRMNRVYAVESSFSISGSVADHRLPVRSMDVGAFAAELDALLTEKLGVAAQNGPAQPRPVRPWLDAPKVRAFIDALVVDLIEARGKSVVLAGDRQPAAVHALAHRLNVILGNVGQTIAYVDAPEAQQDPRPTSVQLGELVRDMQSGQVSTLFVLGGNPVLSAPSDLGFAEALRKVKQSVHLSVQDDETSELANWHVPMAHYLESWGDARAFDGTISMVQPLILPLFSGRSTIEILAFMSSGVPTAGREILRKTHGALSDAEFKRAIHDGVIADSAFPPITPTLRPLGTLELPDSGVEPESLELVLSATSNLHDGRFANNAWLLELPDPISKVTWENAALLAPKTAKSTGVTDGDRVRLSIDGKTINVTAVIAPGQAERSVMLALGWGRTAAGGLGGSRRADVTPVGANAYPLRTSKQPFLLRGLKIAATGERQQVASTQELHAIDQRGREGWDSRLGMIVRQGSLGQFKANPEFAQEAVHHPPLLQMWEHPISYDGHRWALSIDLNKCTGCNACMIACQSENNIPTVGKENVAKGREMHWIRIDRYYTGEPEAPEVTFQPMGCQHCENAPCEQVCPVGATMHSSEGLNEMAYNRCVGTRYCSNNCPYKVRRFNYFNFHLELKDPKQLIRKMVFNPDVTVRARGVMEKCTFCVQRIQRVKIHAKNDRRNVEDGEIVTACQQTCPTGAIVFGDLNDKASQVAKLQSRSRSYAVLGELNNRPRVQYLARIRNPNPKLV
jgi:molybdopterin-containing oxidoreductase family iron-sulfur binding subunit